MRDSRNFGMSKSPTIYADASSGKMHKYVTEKSKRLYEQILVTKDELNIQVTTLDKNLQGIIESNEYDYMQAYNIFVKKKEEELKGLIE